MKFSFKPYEDYTIFTNLPVEEVVKRIKDNIEPRGEGFFEGLFKTPVKPYTGKLETTNFKITRIISYNNSFLPIITGKIEAHSRGSMIHIKMKMQRFVFGLLCFCLLFLTVDFILITLQQIIRMKFNPGLLAIPGFIAFVYIVITAIFKSESSESKKFLVDLFEAEAKETNAK